MSNHQLKKVVIDTNVFVSFLLSQKSSIGAIYDLWDTGVLQIVYSTETFEELIRALEYPKIQKYLKPERKQALIHTLQIQGNLCVVTHSLKVSRDPNDDMFINLCLSSGAEYLITGDKDLLELAQSFPFKIVAPADFIKTDTP